MDNIFDDFINGLIHVTKELRKLMKLCNGIIIKEAPYDKSLRYPYKNKFTKPFVRCGLNKCSIRRKLC